MLAMFDNALSFLEMVPSCAFTLPESILHLTQDQMRWLKMGVQTIWPSIGTESNVTTFETASLHRNFGSKTITGLVGLALVNFSEYLTLSNTAKHCWHVCWWGYHGINSVGTVQGRNTLRWAGQRRADTAWRLVITAGTGQVSLRQTRNLCRLL